VAISFRGAATPVTAANGGAVAVDLTTISGLAQNDLVIFAYMIASGNSANVDMAPSEGGWTEVADLFQTDNIRTDLGVFYKKMGASPDTTVTGPATSDATHSLAAVAMAFTGVDTTTPMDVAAATASGPSTFIPNPPSIDHNNPSGLWTVIVGAAAHGQNAQTYTFPTGYTTNATQTTGLDDSDSSIGMGYRTNPSDPEDPGTMVLSGTDSTLYSWAAVTMALRPAASGGVLTSVTFVGL